MEHYGGQPTSQQTYGSLPSIAPGQLQQHAQLPPLQAQHAPTMSPHLNNMYSQQQSMSAPHTPTTTTPNTPGSVGNGGFQQLNQQNAQRGYHPQGNSYQQPIHSYTSSSMMPQAPTAMSHPQAIAPAPVSNLGGRGFVPLRPNNPSTPMHNDHPLHSMHQAPPPYGHPHDQSVPTHVVGSQGRRGILPSAPGRPPVASTGTGSTKNTPIPAKDAEGKFPCPHCTKTYLHAKHLKRHLLRHTGDRPYMCVLCKDTFSRSDILKRHFQKCSIRRGNPSGLSHLEFAQSHLKKNQQGANKTLNSTSADGVLARTMNGAHGLPGDSNEGRAFMMGDSRVGDTHPSMPGDDSDHLSHPNGLKGLGSGGVAQDRRTLTGPGPTGPNRANYEQGFSSNIPTSLPSSINVQIAPYAMPNGHGGGNFGQNYDFAHHQNNGNSVHASNDASGSRGVMYGDHSQSWQGVGQMFTSGAQDGYINSFNTNLVQNQMPIKTEPSMVNSSEDLYNGLYNVANSSDLSADSYPIWAMPLFQNDPVTVEHIALETAAFCCPPVIQGPRATLIRSILSVDNFKHFMELFTNFQGHFPILHMPTFRISDAYKGLLLAMVCIGSVYSDRVSPSQVRELMEQARAVIERDSHVFQAVTRDSSEDPNFGNDMFGRNKRDLEEIQAVFLLHSIFTWHGTPLHREMSRQKFPILVRLARLAGLTRPSTSSQLFSPLHQPSAAVNSVNSANFDWDAWVQQEKLSRIFFTIFLCDTAMCLYFNAMPNFDGREIALPLPCDDAAWEARSAGECAQALGLPGAMPILQPQGTGKPKQLELSVALQDLLDPTAPPLSGTSNIMSKFILVHSLVVLVWRAQRLSPDDLSPAPQNHWTGKTEGGLAQRTLTESHKQSRMISNALDKWKKNWEIDMANQYPPSSTSLRRFGFCRDGIHFYYLGKYLIKANLSQQVAPDQRLSQVIHLLKSLGKWALTESAQRGEEVGSVGEIDKEFGETDLTLNMSHLFKPINNRIDSPIPGVHTNIRSGLI